MPDFLNVNSKIKSQPDPLSCGIELAVDADLPMHPEYTYYCSCYKFWQASYKAGHRYKNATDCDGQPVFHGHENETDGSKARRKATTPVIGFVKPVVSRYNNTIFTSTIHRDQDNNTFIEWMKNVDLRGTCLNDFVRCVSEQAQILGRYFVILDSTKTSDMLSEAQVKANKDQLFLAKLHPARVINWYEDDGYFSEMLVLFPEELVARYYTETTVQTVTYVVDKDGERKISAITPPQPHGFNRVPVISFCCDDDYQPQAVDIAEYQKAIYNLHSVLIEEAYKQIFTSYMVCGADLNDINEANNPTGKEMFFSKDVGNRKFTFISKPNVTVNRLSADASMSEQLLKILNAEIENVYKSAGLDHDLQTKTGNVESAKSHQLKSTSFASIARALADHFQESENQIIRLWAEGMNQKVADSEYFDDFTSDDLSTQLQEALELVAAEIPATLKARAIEALAPKMVKLDNDDTDAIRKEAEEMYKAQASIAAKPPAPVVVQPIGTGNQPPAPPPAAPSAVAKPVKPEEIVGGTNRNDT